MTEFLDNYSPFEDPQDEPDQPAPQAEVRIDPPHPGRLPTPSPAARPAATLTEEQLQAYEERLNALENTITGREAQLRESGRMTDPAANWPKCYPVVYFNINDVPERQRPYVHQALFAWLLMAIAFFCNWIGCLCLIKVSDDSIESPGSKIALSSLYLFILMPLALDLDAMSVYRALQGAPMTFPFLKIFAALSISGIFELVMFLGLNDSGSVGLISTIDLFVGKYVGLGAWGALVTGLFLVSLLLHMRLLRQLWKFYRGAADAATMENDVRRGLTEFVVQTLA